ncbi:hypothetical protein [Acetobacter malorum]|uniref:hypothetical protein n=1 Tax=Acetobacter malorum TaxID=178901 RepID=UPI00077724FB|nr:hypothetical protein [Acetobacter malorum]KXV05675.1 hypothetical protein AD930_11105 [Acetobacter malorum]
MSDRQAGGQKETLMARIGLGGYLLVLGATLLPVSACVLPGVAMKIINSYHCPASDDEAYGKIALSVIGKRVFTISDEGRDLSGRRTYWYSFGDQSGYLLLDHDNPLSDNTVYGPLDSLIHIDGRVRTSGGERFQATVGKALHCSVTVTRSENGYWQTSPVLCTNAEVDEKSYAPAKGLRG